MIQHETCSVANKDINLFIYFLFQIKGESYCASSLWCGHKCCSVKFSCRYFSPDYMRHLYSIPDFSRENNAICMYSLMQKALFLSYNVALFRELLGILKMVQRE